MSGYLPTAGQSLSCVKQVITIKPKYVAENHTGMQIEIKQRGTPDPGQNSLEDRCAWRLGHNERCDIVPNTFATYVFVHERHIRKAMHP